MGTRRPAEAVDHQAVVRAYPPPPEYFESAWLDPPEVIEAKQLVRLRARADRARLIPFHARRWADAGVSPDDLRTLDDLWRFPTYDVDDLRRSIEAQPPWGDYQGVTPEIATREPMRVYMSGGTTGKSRPTFYTQWDREVGSLLIARQLYMQGIRPGDVVLNSWSYGTHNGAFAFDEALYRWLNCVVLTTSTGAVTSTRKQVELALEYGATAINTTGDYVLRVAEVAREMGIDPRQLPLRSLPNIGDVARLEETFGLPVLRTYGIHEAQTVAIECPERAGLHVFEDAFVIHVVDPDTGEPLPDGETGSLVVTELYKTGSAQFRYDTMDLSALLPRQRCACGSWLRRIAPFAGRADNMVKLRGVNVWPEALGDLAMTHPGVTNDYFVRARRAGGRDTMLLSIASEQPVETHPGLAAELATLLKDRIGVQIDVEVVRPGALDELTEVDRSPKLKRFRDER